MTLRKTVKIVLALLVILALAVGLTSINHPIILKWLTGSAKHHGAPMSATVYTNGKVNDHIKVFYTDEAKSYLVSLAEYDNAGKLEFMNINLDEKWIGRPAAMSSRDYDLIAGHLFQSETGGKFSPFQDDIKGFNFDPQLSFEGKQIKFNMPPNNLQIDSVRIILP
ncbi:hypothetical protein [Aridibaculum aurantiacum]|uniref:hypothetical protein n=1 Tax=Aridibaculum aurantiacum TaxID=2810307 RepID=UPI001A96D8C8|nr:hypothetical protein [Aridibaculum aurantiacum]